jgi:hypothetical protein
MARMQKSTILTFTKTVKVFRGVVTMTPEDRSQGVVRPVMTHFFYMDEANPTKVSSWIGPVAF